MLRTRHAGVRCRHRRSGGAASGGCSSHTAPSLFSRLDSFRILELSRRRDELAVPRWRRRRQGYLIERVFFNAQRGASALQNGLADARLLPLTSALEEERRAIKLRPAVAFCACALLPRHLVPRYDFCAHLSATTLAKPRSATALRSPARTADAARGDAGNERYAYYGGGERWRPRAGAAWRRARCERLRCGLRHALKQLDARCAHAWRRYGCT